MKNSVKVTKTVDGETVEGEVLTSSAPAYERNGWTVADDESSEKGDAPVANTPQPSLSALAQSAQSDPKASTQDERKAN